MLKNLRNVLMLCCCVLFTSSVMAQISGVILDEMQVPLIGVSVLEVGTTNGVITDLDGSYTISPSGYPCTLEYSYVGYTTKKIVFNSAGVQDVVMSSGVGLDEVVVTGTRGKPRTILDSPVPIDNFNVDQLVSSGKTQVDQMLNYKVPSFNSQNQAISDATAHYDPADLRGLGPSRTLVLVNGKRKNQSAQVYLNRTPGKGEVGVDLKSIPAAAIERVEVLRDGASAQYGSDAIAGVINMILKKDVEYTSWNSRAGITSKGDGFNFATDLNTSVALGEGTMNLTLGYFNQQKTNRAGEVNAATDQGPSPKLDAVDADGNPIYSGADDPKWIADKGFWDRNEAWLAQNPTAGMIVGQPDMNKFDGFVNIEHPIGDLAKFYTFHGITSRTGRSFAYYRAPYWRRDVANANHFTTFENFIGYHPTFETAIMDNINSAGFQWDMFGLNADASVTYGGNRVGYTVNNSVNRDYLKDHGWSPSSFNPGGYSFSNVIGNLDFNTTVGSNENVFIGFGMEAKKERFGARKGDPFSYYKGGSDSFAGIKPEEQVKQSRTSYAGYATVDYDITESLLFGGAVRYENFSDFGGNFSWKLNSRYKLGDRGAIRASVSTGFRAPTLHQRYLINSQYIIVAGSPDPQLQGTLANDNPAVQALGVPNLFAETSFNYTAGLTYRLSDNISASLDYYNIAVNNRVLFSSQITAKAEGDKIDEILSEKGVKSVQFFINAGNTTTQGLDFVINANNFDVGTGKFGAILSANFNNTKLDEITTPPILKEGGYDIFDRREVGLIVDSRPKSKIILGLNYDVGNFSFGLDNTRFGEVAVRAADPKNDQVHAAKIVTDLRLGYDLNDAIGLTFNVNNIFDVYPDLLDPKTGESANERFDYTSVVQQQNFLGTNFVVGLNVKLAKLGIQK